MLNQLKIILASLMFFTRIPFLSKIDCSKTSINKAIHYYPFVGWVVGGFSALVFYIASFVFPLNLSIIFSIISSVLLTGALHEDGFADVCDGFGGGWTKEKILAIMKDSRIGGFGVIGLILIFLLRFFSLTSVKIELIPFVIIAGNSLSRMTSASVIFSNKYVREEESSKSKDLAEKISVSGLIIVFFFGLMPLILFYKQPIFVLSLIPVMLVKWLMSMYFRKWIGGYTGDCLGAIQQVTEVIFYLSIIILQTIIL